MLTVIENKSTDTHKKKYTTITNQELYLERSMVRLLSYYAGQYK